MSRSARRLAAFAVSLVSLLALGLAAPTSAAAECKNNHGTSGICGFEWDWSEGS